MGVLPVCVYMHHECLGPEEGRRRHWIPCNWRLWEPNLDPLQEHQVLLPTEPSPAPILNTLNDMRR